MRRLRLFAHVSLDGVIAPDEARHGREYADGGWTAPFRSPGGGQLIADAQGPRFDLLLGRRTYDLWSGHWPKQSGGLFAGPINAATKFVATHRPESLAWGPSRALGPDLATDVARLKSEPGPDLILWGSTTLTPTLLAADLIDELALVTYPVLLGAGKRLFPLDATPATFTLAATVSTPTGVTFSTYRRAK